MSCRHARRCSTRSRALTGDYLQQPPAFSAKKVAGRRAYRLARQDQPVVLTPAPVRVAVPTCSTSPKVVPMSR